MWHSLTIGWQNFRVLSIDMAHRFGRHWRFPLLVGLTTLLGCAYVWEHTYYLDLAARVEKAGLELDLLTKLNKQSQLEISTLDQRVRIDRIAVGQCNYRAVPVDGILTLRLPRNDAPFQVEPSWTARLLAQVLATNKTSIN